MAGGEVKVLAVGGGPLRRLACGLGLHHEVCPEEGTGLPRIRYCNFCGESGDTRWKWKFSETVPFTPYVVVTYASAGSA
jgi:hypothetical protein